VLAPAGTPKTVVARLHEVLSKQLATPEARELYANQGHEIGGEGLEEYAAFLKAEIEKWARVAKAANIPRQ
jgi:tripartite-type tricarboxylate transporter receptor subunit TctC